MPTVGRKHNLAEVHQKHNGIYEELRSESKNPEPQKYPKSDDVSEGALERASSDKVGKEAVWHITDSVC